MITLRPHQVEAVAAVEAAFASGVRRPLVDACVGSGKSLIYAELARRELLKGGRAIIAAHTRELVEQNASACRALGLPVEINAAALGKRCWDAPVISAGIQSIYESGRSFRGVTLLCGDEAHLWPHSESGMYRALHRDLGYCRLVGGSGTVFRLQGGSLIEGDEAPFDQIVYQYSILNGIRDGYLVPAYSAEIEDGIDPTKLRVTAGEFTAGSQDKQTIEAIDNHITQMVYFGRDRHGWIIFEASEKAARAMCARMREWGIPTGLVLGKTAAAERIAIVEAFRTRRLRALVNISALTTGFDVQHADMLVMRRRTASLGLYIQITGRVLRTIGGNIDESIKSGKSDALVLDFAGNIDLHGPLDCIRPRNVKASLVRCDACNKLNSRNSSECWACGETLTKNCPACLTAIEKHLLDCPHCGHDMRAEEISERGQGLLQRPTGAAIISAYSNNKPRVGGWQPVKEACQEPEGTAILINGSVSYLFFPVVGELMRGVRWARLNCDGQIDAVLVPNGKSKTSALQINAQGANLIVPLPVQCN